MCYWPLMVTERPKMYRVWHTHPHKDWPCYKYLTGSSLRNQDSLQSNRFVWRSLNLKETTKEVKLTDRKLLQRCKNQSYSLNWDCKTRRRYCDIRKWQVRRDDMRHWCCLWFNSSILVIFSLWGSDITYSSFRCLGYPTFRLSVMRIYPHDGSCQLSPLVAISSELLVQQQWDTFVGSISSVSTLFYSHCFYFSFFFLISLICFMTINLSIWDPELSVDS